MGVTHNIRCGKCGHAFTRSYGIGINGHGTLYCDRCGQAQQVDLSGFFNQMSLDLREMFPNATGFSVTNLKYMKRWYAFYYESDAIRQRPVDEFVNGEKRQRAIDQMEMPEIFGQIPWGQHIDIITRCQSLEEALFYIKYL